jgi:uncharacterized protein (DUF433 family)
MSTGERQLRFVYCGILSVNQVRVSPALLAHCGVHKGNRTMATRPTSVQIITDPAILGGKPVIAGTRISVQLVLEELRDGWTMKALLDDYPQLTREQIIAALAYAAEAMGA